MRKLLLRSGMAVALAFGIVAGTGAQGLPGSGWFTTATIQNVGTGAADSTQIQVFPQGTGAASTATFNIPQSGNVIFVPGGNNASNTVDVTPSLPAGTTGSAVVSASQPVVAVGSIQNNQLGVFPGLGTSGGYAAEFFRGASTGAPTLFYPAVKNGWGNKTTIFAVQSAGAAVTIDATIRSNAGVNHTITGRAIGENRAINLLPSDFTPPMPATNCGGDVNTSPCFGTLTVNATGGSIVGTYLEYEVGRTPARLVQAASLFPQTEASGSIYCPVIKNTLAGRSTGMTIANTSNQAVTANVSYSVYQGANSGQSYSQPSISIPANGSVVFSLFGNNLGGMPGGNLAAAKVTTTAGNVLVGVVNEQNFGAAEGSPVKATTYSCFGESSATNRLAAPLFKRNVAGVTSALVVQNVSPTASFTAAATFTCGTNAPVTVTSSSLGPGQSHNFSGFGGNGMDPVATGTNCAVVVNATGPIVGIAQETADFGTAQPLLNTKNYEAFNLQ